MTMQHEKIQTAEEQMLYASVLEKGMILGLVLMLITFALYLSGIMTPAIPVREVAGLWSQDVHSYLVAINDKFLHLQQLPMGWTWMRLMGNGDFLNFLPVAILAGVTMICYLAIVPGLLRRGDKAYAVMAMAEAVILGLAASGILAVGH